METFNHLLNQYVQRAGISDTELARAIGVSRQTIFRWREGETARPRHREDVLVIARKLRLTPAERDTLLLSAGFAPEVTTEEREQRRDEREAGELGGTEGKTTIGDFEELSASTETQRDGAPRRDWRFVWGRYVLILVAALALVGTAVWWLSGPSTGVSSTPTVPPPVLATPAPGETLILVTHFANYAGGQVGYNVAGRLTQALQREIDHTRLQQIRLEIWPEAVGERDQALKIGRTVSATLVIYGEYDLGRVLVQFAQPADQSAFADPALQQRVAGLPELSAAINTDLPQQVRSLALLALGQIYLTQKQAGQARPLLAQARDNLKNEPDVAKTTWALVNFYLGLAYHGGDTPDLNAAITAYTEAIAAWPEMLSSRLNRSAAYQVREQPGDLELALADLDQIIQTKPNWAVAYTNRASLRMAMDGGQNMALAAADLDKARSLDPALPAIYINRAYLAYKRDAPMSSLLTDLDKTLSLQADHAPALNLYCWGYTMEQQPDKALPYCQKAVAADPQPLYVDSRGVTYALLGNTPAAQADFETFTAWLEKQSNPAWQPVLARRLAWLTTLKSGQNPITPTVLADLRHEFGK